MVKTLNVFQEIMASTVNVCLVLWVMLMWNVQFCKVAAQIQSAIAVRLASMVNALRPVAVVLTLYVTLLIIEAFVSVLQVILAIQQFLAVHHRIHVIPILVVLMPYVSWTMAILFVTALKDLLEIRLKIAVSIVLYFLFKY